jgi:hypothetical protein
MTLVQLGGLTEIVLGAEGCDVTREGRGSSPTCGQRLRCGTALQYSVSTCHQQTFYTCLNMFLQGRINSRMSPLVPKITSLFK